MNTNMNQPAYVPTEQDRLQDQLTAEWKEKRNEQARQQFVRSIYIQRRYAKYS